MNRTTAAISLPTTGKYKALHDYMAAQIAHEAESASGVGLTRQALAVDAGNVDTLAGYAAKCDMATKVHLPACS